MTWQSLPMTGDCEYHYEKVRKFTLVKETPDAIRIRLENHPEKISIWMPKKITRGYTNTSAWFWSKALHNNVIAAEQRLKEQRENMKASFKGFNAIYVDKPTNEDVKKVEKIVDSEEEKRKNAEMDEKIHRNDPNKFNWKN